MRREGRADLADAAESGAVSAFSAAVSCGITKRPASAAATTHQAKKRELKLRAITGEGTSAGQLMEMQYGPSASGSFFKSREQLVEAWETHGPEIMARCAPGRRPAIWYEMAAPPDLPRVSYFHERSALWKAGMLEPEEKAVLEAEWKLEFEKTCAEGFTFHGGEGEILRGDAARAAAHVFEDIPPALLRRWEAARKRRRAKKTTEGLRAQPGKKNAQAASPSVGMAV
jgi:hypothetical protein